MLTIVAGAITLALLLSTGCASRKMMVTSRTRANTTLELSRAVTLAGQPNPRPEDAQLKGMLSALLTAANMQADSPASATYVLGYSMDQSWEEVAVPVMAAPPVQRVASYPGANGGPSRTVVTYEYREPFTSQHDSRFLSARGIRLTLFTMNAPAADRPETVWEGYIELESKASGSQMTNALQQLLGKMGTNFIGRVPMAH